MPALFSFFSTRAYTLGVPRIPNQTDGDVSYSRWCDKVKITNKD